MPTSKKPRKAYRQKWAKISPIEIIQEKNRPLEKHGDYLLKWKLRNHAAMTELLAGRAVKAHMDTLVSMVNIVEALFQMGFGSEYDEVVEEGSNAMRELWIRGQRTGRWLCRGPEIAALNAIMELHDQQMGVINVVQMEEAVILGKKLLREKQRRMIALN